MSQRSLIAALALCAALACAQSPTHAQSANAPKPPTDAAKQAFQVTPLDEA